MGIGWGMSTFSKCEIITKILINLLFTYIYFIYTFSILFFIIFPLSTNMIFLISFTAFPNLIIFSFGSHFLLHGQKKNLEVNSILNN